jgi:hypothetical protein
MSVAVLRRRRKKLISNSTTVVIAEPFTPWMPAISVKYVKALIELVDRTTNYKVSWALQTATSDPDSPDAWVQKQNYKNSNGRHCDGILDVSTDVDGKFWVRLGAVSLNESGALLENGDVAITFTFRS